MPNADTFATGRPSTKIKAVAFLLNARAGTCDVPAATALIEKLGAEHGIAVDVVAFEPGSDLTALARKAVERGAEIVAAGGGDGTMNAAATALVGTETALGVLPLGTLNHFAKDLGIPLKLEDAIRNLFSGRVVAVDVGEVNDRFFINNSSLGLYPRIVRQREAHQKRGLPKWIAFIRALFYVAQHHTALYMRIKIDNARTEFRRTPFLFIGNNRYVLSGLQIGKRTALTGARLWLCKAPGIDRAALLRLTLRALSGRLRDDDLEAEEVQEAWIEVHAPRPQVATDGEVQTMTSPLHYRIRPQALKVIVPRPIPPST